MGILDTLKNWRSPEIGTSAPVVKEISDGQRVQRAVPFDPIGAKAAYTPTSPAGFLAQIIPEMYQAWGAYGYMPSITWYQLSTMYVSWNYTAIEKKARTIAMLPFRLYRYEKTTGKKVLPYELKSISTFGSKREYRHYLKALDIQRIEVTDHPALELMAHINEDTTPFNFKRSMAIRLELDGSVGIYKSKFFPNINYGYPTELQLLPTTWTGNFKPVPGTGKEGIIKGFRYIDMDINQFFTKDEIIWIHYDSLRNPFEGMSAVKAQLYPFNIDQYLQQQLISFYKNGMLLSNTFSTDQQLTKAQFEQIMTDVRQYVGARNHWQPFVGHSGLKPVSTMNASMTDANVPEIARESRDRILSSHDTSAGKVGLTETQNKANLEAVNSNYLAEAIQPTVTLICENLDKGLIKKHFSPEFNCDFEIRDYEDRAQDLEEHRAFLTLGKNTINEIREIHDEEPVEWGDKPIMPMSMQHFGEGGISMPVGNNPSQQGKPKPQEQTPPDETGKSLSTKAYWTAERKALAWKAYDIRLNGLEPLIVKAMKKVFEWQCEDVISKLESHGFKTKAELAALNKNNKAKWLAEHKDRVEAFIDFPEWVKKTKKEMEPAYIAILTEAGQERIDKFSGKKAMQIKADDEGDGTDDGAFNIEFNVHDPNVKQWLGDRLEEKSKITSQTTKDAVKDLLKADFEQGEPLLKMSEHLRDLFKGAETYRAPLIARTETTAAYTKGELEGIDQMGLGERVGKIWINEPTARETHQAAGERYSDGTDGETGELMTTDKKFTVGKDTMLSPGNGDEAEENCNCRCGLEYEIVNQE